MKLKVCLTLLFLILLVTACEEPSDNTITNKMSVPEHVVTNTSESEIIKEENINEEIHAEVSRVVDGDTIKIIVNGKEETVRLLLVDTPETKHPNKPVQPFGPEATEFAKETLEGKNIQVEYDGPQRDKYDRLLAYIWIDGNIFNEMLLENGLARLAYVYDPPYTHYDRFVKAQTNAVNVKKGIWSIEGYVTEDGFNSAVDQKDNYTSESSNNELLYDPFGPDRDCSDFDTQQQAQAFYEAAGGPNSDHHRLDGNDKDGIVCESLP